MYGNRKRSPRVAPHGATCYDSGTDIEANLMTQLNQIIAIESGVKPRAKKDFALAQRIFETKVAQLNGISRTYHPLNEDGEKFPPESTRVQVNVQEILSEVQKALIRFFDVTLTKDVANTLATADIVVDGVTIAENVPPPTLLFLEKELSELLLFIGKIPVLDLGEEWSYDDNVNAYATPPAQTAKTKKVPRNHVKWAPPNNLSL